MKIIISHDVDHLYPKDHIFRDLYFPKLWARSIIDYVKGKCGFSHIMYNFGLLFSKRMHRLSEIMAFDKEYDVSSTFFFGMRSGLGMSYHSSEAKELIVNVVKNGFCVGVHGIIYDNFNRMKEEFDEFTKIVGSPPKGIRMHYVRCDEKTFNYENDLGYLFDSTEFDKKEKGSIKAPYKVGDMWEFPLGLMDVYMPDNIDDAKKFTIARIEDFQRRNIEYMTVLFHDNYYSKQSLFLKQWYQWFISYIDQAPNLKFISFEEAIQELEKCLAGK